MAKVALVRCADYDPDIVESAVRRAIDLLGGISRYVHPGDKVIVKPNLLRASRPEAAVVTHPAVVRAVVRLAQEAGGVVTILDSPGGPVNSALIRGAYRLAGWQAVADETGARLGYDYTGTLVAAPEGRLMKRFDILAEVAAADCVITVPKLKTHGFMRFTGATKILFGVVPGMLKLGYHAKLQDAEAFAEMLLDLLGLVKPRLSIMDAIIGMEGKGPSAGRPRQIGALLASADSVALDAAAATLVGLEPLAIPTLKAAAARGLWSGDPAGISTIGEDLDALRVPDFEPAPDNHGIDGMRRFMPGRLRTWMSGELLLTPQAAPARCTGCETCFQSCPVQAISMPGGKAFMDPAKCIRCYCCHELCPVDAIDLERGRLGRLLIR